MYKIYLNVSELTIFWHLGIYSYIIFVSLQSAKLSCVKTPTFPAPSGLGSTARLRITPTPPLPAPSSQLEPRWPLVVPFASPCHSCCLSPLCCYHCCSPALTPYVSIQTLLNFPVWCLLRTWYADCSRGNKADMWGTASFEVFGEPFLPQALYRNNPSVFLLLFFRITLNACGNACITGSLNFCLVL